MMDKETRKLSNKNLNIFLSLILKNKSLSFLYINTRVHPIQGLTATQSRGIIVTIVMVN